MRHDAGAVARHAIGVRQHEGDAVAGREEEIRPGIMLRSPSPSEAGGSGFSRFLDERGGIDGIRVRMDPAEVGQWFTADDGARGSAELIDEDAPGVGAGDAVHGVEEDATAIPEPRADQVEVEEALHQHAVGFRGVRDFDLQRPCLTVPALPRSRSGRVAMR